MIRIWLVRTLIGVVLIINLQSALVFFLNPGKFAPAYELAGVPGQAAIRGFAVLFIMWTVPYLIALINPIKYRVSLYEAIAMLSIAFLGETWILRSLPIEHTLLRESILRFIIFDGGGLIALIVAALIANPKSDMV